MEAKLEFWDAFLKLFFKRNFGINFFPTTLSGWGSVFLTMPHRARLARARARARARTVTMAPPKLKTS